MKKKTVLISIAIVLTLVIAAAVFAACGKVNKSTQKAELNATDIFAYGAASSGAILESIGSGNGVSAETTGEDKLQQKIDTVKKYMTMVETFIGENQMNVTESVSDREGYAKLLTVLMTDLEGNSYTYSLYFNETNLVDDGDDKDEGELEYNIDGILLLNGTEYTVIGEKEIENNESEISFTAKLDDKNYVKISHETESDEKSFEYEVYQDGNLTDKFEIEIETEQNETELELKTLKNGIIEVFKFEKETENGVDLIKITNVKNDNTEVIKVYIEKKADGTEEYRFVSGQNEIRSDRPDFDDDDD